MGKRGNPARLHSSPSSLSPLPALEIMNEQRTRLVLEFMSAGEMSAQKLLAEKILQLTPNDSVDALLLQSSDPKIDQLVKHCFKTLIDDILDLSWASIPPFPWSKKFIKEKFPTLIKEVHKYRTTPKLKSAGPLVQKIASLLPSCAPKTTTLLLKRLQEFVSNFHKQIMQTKLFTLLSPSSPKLKEGKKLRPHEIYKREFQHLLQILHISSFYFIIFANFPSYVPGSLIMGEPRLGLDETLLSLDILSYIHFCRVSFEDDVVYIKRALEHVLSECEGSTGVRKVWEGSPKPLIFYKSFPNIVSQYQNLQSIEKEDDLLYNRAQFYLSLMESILHDADEEFITQELIPVLFFYIQHSSIFTNAMAHSMIREIISIQSEGIGAKLIPKYIQTSLRHFPSVTRVESLVKSMTFIVDVLPARDPAHAPIAIYCIEAHANRIKEISQGKKSPQATKLFSLSLLFLLNVCDVSILMQTLEIIENLIIGAPERAQKDFCITLQQVITKNYDPMRKSVCVNWFLHLLDFLQIKDLSADKAGPQPPAIQDGKLAGKL